MMKVDFDDDDDDKMIIPMVLSPAMQFPMQSRVVLRDLKRQKNLNNHLAVVEEYLWEECRYKVRPLSRQAKRSTKSKYLSIQPENLHLVSPSAFIAKVTDRTGDSIRVPLECLVELDDKEEDPQEQQLVVKLIYADFWGKHTQHKIRDELNASLSCHPDPNVLEVLNSPIDYEEYLEPDQYLQGDEILILYPKPLIEDFYDAMFDYELLKELDLTINVGLHGGLSLCRLWFPFQLPEVPVPISSSDNNNNNNK